MNTHICAIAALSLVATSASAQTYVPPSATDSAYLFGYATAKNKNHNGLHFAWSIDRTTWHEIGPEYAFVKGDYGNWGPEKRMITPSLHRQTDGTWEIIFRPNEREAIVAYATSPDLVHWTPQDYYNYTNGELSTHTRSWEVGGTSDPTLRLMKTVYDLPTGGSTTGEEFKVEWAVVQGLIDEVERVRRLETANSERLVDDSIRFRGLQTVRTHVAVASQNAKPISSRLLGIFFEDISYAADGGLYAELVQNRDFEYHPRDQRWRDPKWNATYAWDVRDGAVLTIDSVNPIHANNPHYAVINSPATPSGRPALVNKGWDGIVVRRGERYDLSLWGRTQGTAQSVVVELRSSTGEVIARGTVPIGSGDKWQKSTTTLTATGDSRLAELAIVVEAGSTYHFDMVSLFPQATFKGRKNGLRADLAQALADMKPRFVRFPGGCVAHGDGLDNTYRWKNTIGPLEARVPNWNIWRYHQTVGLGFYEYFQMCEDLGAEPLPVLAAGVPCQNSCVPYSRRDDGAPLLGQQGGLSADEMNQYVQDVLDLVEWANGDPRTSPWAKMRADAGHPRPFGLKMIGIGNEDLISETFKARFEQIYRAVKSKYPDIEVVGTVGPFFEGADYDEGWRLANRLGIDIVDEHYYCPLGWFLNHSDFYDRYRRGGTKVYLGEYSAQVPKKVNCMESALAEAHYLCNVERNADVVEMVSYAPLFAKRGYTRWNPDMIYFDNTDVTLTAGYQVQRLFGNYAGQSYLPSQSTVQTSATSLDGEATRRVAVSCVRDVTSGDIIVKVANLLPVANDIEVALPALTPRVDRRGQPTTPVLSAETLTGALDAVRVDTRPLAGASLDGSTLHATLPAYSFSAFRIAM